MGGLFNFKNYSFLVTFHYIKDYSCLIWADNFWIWDIEVNVWSPLFIFTFSLYLKFDQRVVYALHKLWNFKFCAGPIMRDSHWSESGSDIQKREKSELSIWIKVSTVDTQIKQSTLKVSYLKFWALVTTINYIQTE